MRSIRSTCSWIFLLILSSLAAGQPQLSGPVPTPGPVQVLIGPQSAGVYHVAYSPDGRWLASSGKHGTIALWDVATGKQKTTLKVAESAVFNAAFSADSKRLVTAGDDNRVRLWDVAAAKEIWDGSQTHVKSVYVVAISPDGRHIASGGGDNRVILWDAATGRMLTELVGHTDRVMGLVFTPDSRLISACGTQGGGGDAGGQVKVWDVAVGKELFDINDEGRGVVTLALSADGRRLAGSCMDKTVCVWEMASGKPCQVLSGHTRPVYGVAFSPDGRQLASCDADWNGGKGAIKIWDLAAAREVCTPVRYRAPWLPNVSSPVWSVAFSPDGKRLAAASGRFHEDGFGTTSIWDMTTMQPSAAVAGTEPTAKELEALWADLASEDAVRAYRSMWALRACPRQSVPFLRSHARTPPWSDPLARVAKLIEELDSEDFDTRQRAETELEKLGSVARPALHQALESASAEVRQRAAALLERKCRPPYMSPEELRILRTIEVLETVVHPEARALLEKLAGGPSGSFVAADAAAALVRLRRPSER